MEPRITDVEVVKKRARKAAATQVLAGGVADVCLDLGALRGCRACLRAGYGVLSPTAVAEAGDRLVWILDGYADIHSSSGQVTRVSQGESTVLAGGQAYQLVFPTLTLYVSVQAGEPE